ncbi:MAG: ISAs1 family transposase [Shimia sp.]|nr:ISAs1 family transposase [Shimia sp.]
MATGQVPPLMEILAEIPDNRQRQGRRHPLPGMLALACVATLRGYKSIKAIAEWGANYGEQYAAQLGFEGHGYPAQPTWYRVFRGLDIEKVEAKLGEWSEWVLQSLTEKDQREGISIDGKTLRGSRKQGAPNSHLLAAATHRLGSVLAQVAVDDHTNEIGQVEELLLKLVLKGRVVTTDSLLTQRKVAETMVKKGGDYLLPIKQNQPSTYEALVYWFDGHPPRPLAHAVAEQTAKGHGRLTHWRLETTTALNDYLDWCGLAQCFKLTCRTTYLRSGHTQLQTHYGITSLEPQRAAPAALLHCKRDHWTIENRLHWVRDVTFDEDRSQVRMPHAYQLMAAVRNLVITLLRSIGRINIASSLRHFAAHPELALRLLTDPLSFGQ